VRLPAAGLSLPVDRRQRMGESAPQGMGTGLNVIFRNESASGLQFVQQVARLAPA